MKTGRDVRIVAVLFLIAGVMAIVRMIQTGTLELSPGVLGIPIGIGLLNYSNAWRIAAVVTLWLGLATLVLVGGIALSGGNVAITGFGSHSPVVITAFALVTVALTLWQLRVLTRPAVRPSFELGDPAA